MLKKRVDVTRWPEGSPQRCYANYLLTWQEKHWRLMSDCCQITWLEEEKTPMAYLKNSAEDIGVISLLFIDDPVYLNPDETLCDMAALVEFYVGGKIKKRKMMPRLIKESDPYKPDRNGTWGVNPIASLRTEKQVSSRHEKYAIV